MKKLLFLYSITLLAILTFSCEQTKECCGSVPANEKSYIQGFFELGDIHVSPISGVKVDKEKKIVSLMSTSFDASKIYEITDGLSIRVSLSFGAYGIGKGLIDWTKNNPYVNYYNELVEKIGDTSFNSEAVHQYGYEMFALADTLQSVNITCDKQIDGGHLVGNNLNDIFSIYVQDPYAIVKNGYKTITGSNYYSLDGSTDKYPLSLFGAQLASVNWIEKPYIGVKLDLVLDITPEHTDDYTFTVSVTNKQGKTIEKTAEPIRIKGLD
jgi:hypothetical protein